MCLVVDVVVVSSAALTSASYLTFGMEDCTIERVDWLDSRLKVALLF